MTSALRCSLLVGPPLALAVALWWHPAGLVCFAVAAVLIERSRSRGADASAGVTGAAVPTGA